jgi:tetratricopeptide (TPR) repeat protein
MERLINYVKGDGMKSISKILVNVVILISVVNLNGCSTSQTPSWLKIVHWKKDKTPLDLSIDHFEKGQKYETAGNRQKAIEEYEAAQKLSPRPIVYYKLGLLNAAQGQYDLAKTNFKNAIKLDPNFEEAKKELATLETGSPPVSMDTTGSLNH